MPVITGVAAQKSKKRVNIYVDGKFSFGLDLDNYLKFGLKEGKEVTQEQIEEIVKKSEFAKIFDKVVRFGMVRPRSEKEFRDWLKKYKVHKSLHKALFVKLKKLELLDDKSFALWWVSQRLSFRPRGKTALRMELARKGIPKIYIEEALLEIVVDELKLAQELVEKKKRVWEHLSVDQMKKRVYMILASKGFGWDVAKRIMQKIREEKE